MTASRTAAIASATVGFDAGSLQCLVPSGGAQLLDRLTFETEDHLPVFADLLLQDRHGFAVEWHRYRLPGLRFVGVDPGESTLQVDSRPL